MPLLFGRKALLVTLVLLLVAAMVFTLAPKLDLHASDAFEDMAPAWRLRLTPWAEVLRSIGLWTPVVSGCALAGVLLCRLVGVRFLGGLPTRNLLAVLLLLLLGPGLLVNGLLKEHWGRPRPVVALEAWEDGNHKIFKPWWNPTGVCPSNCSFVSGEVAGAETLVAMAAILPVPVLGVSAALAFTAGVAVLRVAFGGHFLSDVLFAALFTHLLGIALFAAMRRAGRLDRDPGGRSLPIRL